MSEDFQLTSLEVFLLSYLYDHFRSSRDGTLTSLLAEPRLLESLRSLSISVEGDSPLVSSDVFVRFGVHRGGDPMDSFLSASSDDDLSMLGENR